MFLKKKLLKLFQIHKAKSKKNLKPKENKKLQTTKGGMLEPYYKPVKKSIQNLFTNFRSYEPNFMKCKDYYKISN